jgi:hypothetical protein
MNTFPAAPPVNRKELFARVSEIIQHGWYDMEANFAGTGRTGAFLEKLLGKQADSQDIADSTGWEIKTFTDKTNLITLFHKEAGPENIMRYMVRKHGWKDAQGRLSFRHTIAGRSDRFQVVDDSQQVIVKPLKGNGPVPTWSHDELLNAASKLRRLLLIKAECTEQKARFTSATCFEELHLGLFVAELLQGIICIDFDVREASPGSGGLRNHGTKFRVSPLNVCRLYLSKRPMP